MKTQKLKLLMAILLAGALLFLPTLAEGQARSQGQGRGSQGSGRSSGSFNQGGNFRSGGSGSRSYGGQSGHRSGGYQQGGSQRSGGGFQSGSNYRAPVYRGSPAFRQGAPYRFNDAPNYRTPAHRGNNYRHYPHNYGSQYYGGWYWGIPFFAGLGFLSGYWWDGYYYSFPYQNVCRRFIPTGAYHTETQQDPNTGQFYEVEVPDGYWETIPCR
jgi:hypothetical protein